MAETNAWPVWTTAARRRSSPCHHDPAHRHGAYGVVPRPRRRDRIARRPLHRGPDVGSGPVDMSVIGGRTPHVCCRPVEDGGSGDSSVHTARGTLAALGAVADEVFGSPELAGRSFGVIGLGAVGAHVARLLTRPGARLVVTDINPAARSLAEERGVTWVDPDHALATEVDVLVPAALGGLLTARRCRGYGVPLSPARPTTSSTNPRGRSHPRHRRRTARGFRGPADRAALRRRRDAPTGLPHGPYPGDHPRRRGHGPRAATRSPRGLAPGSRCGPLAPSAARPTKPGPPASRPTTQES
ncbi:NAD(P)-dependent oxidoreductase [Streptomyces sviceus]|uniref:NAD(P)-dependent oxidoreductase n=1 Tax=Streptomyces sviceus TaxID=285530 RepID=UPI003825CBA7